MIIKVGSIVNHVGALGWGAGKVLEVTATLAMIQFSDGKSRKIAASHFKTLEPAVPSTYLPLAAAGSETKPVRTPRVPRKNKLL